MKDKIPKVREKSKRRQTLQNKTKRNLYRKYLKADKRFCMYET